MDDRVCPGCDEGVDIREPAEWESNRYWHTECLYLAEGRGTVRECPDCGVGPGMDCLYDCSSNWKDGE
jgi:hypothetical protein